MALEDKIGRQQLVDKIKYLIENLPQDEHFCLALDGEWGSGKTFVMEMLRESLSEHSEYIVINYDAWKNNFYSDPLIAILYCLLDGIKEYISILPEVKEKVKNGVLKSIKSFGKDALSAMKKSGGKVALFAYIIEGITNIVVQSGKLESHQKFADFRSYQSLLEDVKKQLNNITEAEIYDGKQTKLVVMVDEIDRCLPNEQLIVLERLHHLFDVKNCVVIVALNKKAISKTFEKSYGGDGDNYQRKFFDFTFVVKTLPERFIYRLLKQDLMPRLQKLPNFHKEQAEIYLNSAYRIIADYLKNSPNNQQVENRSVLRFYNALLIIFNLFGWEGLNCQSIFTAILCLFIEHFIDSKVIQNSDKLDRNYIEGVLNLSARNGRMYDKTFHGALDEYKNEVLNEFNQMMNMMARNEDYTSNPNDVFFGMSGLKQLKKLLLIYGAKDEK